MSIIITRQGKNAQRLNKTGVESEDYLQRYIHENPETLPLNEYKEDVQILILSREFPTASGPIDALGVDQDGEIYLIETKLYKNPDKRVVMAQVLDYGASLWQTYGDPEELISQLRASTERHFNMSLEEKLELTFEREETTIDGYLEALRANVFEGRFHFVILMDRLEDRLKHLISYVNQNSRFNIFGVELEFYRHEDFEILIPKLFGAEVKKAIAGSAGKSARRKWNKTSYFEDAIAKLSPEKVDAIQKLFAWTNQRGCHISWGSGRHRGSLNPKVKEISPRSIFSLYSDGQLSLNFAWLHDPPSRPYAERLGNELRDKIPAFSIPENYMEEYVWVQSDVWTKHTSDLIRVLDRVLFNINSEETSED